MNNGCGKCSYPKGEPKGERVCGRCGRPENVPKNSFLAVSRGVLVATQAFTPIAGMEVSVQGDVVTASLPTGRAIANSPPYAPVFTPIAPPFIVAISEPTVSHASNASSATTTNSALPAHSLMGGSAAHRFLNCSGSTALIAGLKLDEGEEIDPDYRRDGTQAHTLAARCLDGDVDAWELVHEYPQLNPEAASAVQVYLDYVRSRPGRRRVEVKIHLPELSPYMLSTLDCDLVPVTEVDDLVLEIVDYKHGEGVYVETDNNDQLMYYACMAIMEDPSFFRDYGKVRLTIAQPRISWAEPIRSWDTTVHELKTWLYEVLLPAMRIEAQDMVLSLGEWCRFCPAKLVCPAMTEAFKAFAGDTPAELETMASEALGREYALTPMVRMRIKAIEEEVRKRMMDRQDVPGVKLVLGKVDRVWKDDAEPALQARFGSMAYTAPKLLSPAAMEKLPEGKAVVGEWAYRPEAGYTIALADDKRTAVTPKSGAEIWGNAVQKLGLTQE